MRYLITITLLITFTLSAISQSALDRIEIEQIVKTIADGWSAGSGAQFAEPFAEGADFIVWNGYYFKASNRKSLADGHDVLFETIYSNTDHHAVLDKIRFIKNDVALIHVYAAITKKGEPKPENPDVLWSAVVQKLNGRWQIISFHNLDLEVFANQELMNSMPMPPKVMYANWYKASAQ